MEGIIKYKTLGLTEEKHGYSLGTDHYLFIFGIRVLTVSVSKNKGWIRLWPFNHGVVWKHGSESLSFSERMGLKTIITVQGYRISYLKP